MKNMDKGLTVPKWVLINRPKVPKMSQNLSAQIVCPSPKVWYFDEKKVSLASVVLALKLCSPNTPNLLPCRLLCDRKVLGSLRTKYILAFYASFTFVLRTVYVKGVFEWLMRFILSSIANWYQLRKRISRWHFSDENY